MGNQFPAFFLPFFPITTRISAMFNFFRSSQPVRRSPPNRKGNNVKSLQKLEDRELMDGASFRSDPILSPSLPSAPAPLPAWQNAAFVDLQHKPVQHIADALTSSTDKDYFKVSLEAGEFLALDIDALGAAAINLDASNLTVRNSSGQIVAAIANSREPNTGVVSPHAALGYQAMASDDYFIQIGTSSGNLGTYELNMHRVGLAEGMQTGSELQASGAMYTWLKGGVLDFAGPTGYGFGIRGNWSQTRVVDPKTTMTISTYKATGAMFLETSFGEVPLTVPSGQTFTVVTKPSTWGGTFGEVKTVTANVGVPLGNIGADLRAKLGLNLDSISLGNKWTIQIGSQVAAQRGIGQALNAVPYLVYADTGAYRAQFGSVTVTNSAATGTVIMADPVDPSIYLRSGNFVFAGSMQGHVPYTPKFTPSVPVAPVFGHVFASGNFPLEGLPITVRGDVTMNLDANHDGLWLGGQQNASQLYQHQSVNSQALQTIIDDIRLGVNGQVDAGYDAAGYHFTLPLGQASAVYNGPERHVWFKGASVDPWEGTALEQFQMISTVSIEGSYRPANRIDSIAGRLTHESPYFITATSTYKIFGVKADMTVTLDDTGVEAAVKVKALGQYATLTGRLQSNGDFVLNAHADSDFGPFHGKADFTLSKIGAVKKFTAYLDGKAKWSGSVAGISWSTEAKVTAHLTITANADGSLKYSGTAKASGSVKSSIGSIGFEVSATVSGNKLAFSIPKLGSKSITLPNL